MTDFGKTRSTLKPEELEITESLVFIASNIQTIKEDGTDGNPGFEGYEYDLKSYDKDEYIKIQAETNASLTEQMIQTQLALCDVYEMMV